MSHASNHFLCYEWDAAYKYVIYVNGLNCLMRNSLTQLMAFWHDISTLALYKCHDIIFYQDSWDHIKIPWKTVYDKNSPNLDKTPFYYYLFLFSILFCLFYLVNSEISCIWFQLHLNIYCFSLCCILIL